MNQISVTYVDHMGGDLAVVNAARCSFDKYKEQFDDADIGLIKYLARHEHLSPFRHNQIQLRCSVPVFLSRQLQKHQAGLSWNEVSRRYVSTGVEFFVPDSWRSRPSDGIKQGSGTEEVATMYTNEPWQQDLSVKDWYKWYIDEAARYYNELLDRGVAPEMARMVLPQSMMVDWIWTGNLLSFFHVYRMRIGGGAQIEAQEFAEKLQEVVQPLFPHCWSALKNEPQTN